MRLAPLRRLPTVNPQMFRNNPLGSILVCVLFLLALVSCWMAWSYHVSTKKAYELTLRYQGVLQTKDAMQKLVNETLDYSRTNADIHPLLRQFNLQPRPALVQPPAQSAPRPAR